MTNAWWPCQSTGDHLVRAAAGVSAPSLLASVARSADEPPAAYRERLAGAAELFALHTDFIARLAEAAADAAAAGASADEVAEAVLEAGCFESVASRARAALMDAGFADAAWSFDTAAEIGDVDG